MISRTLQCFSLCIFLASAPGHANPEQKQSSYGDLAASTIPRTINSLMEELDLLGPAIWPHETKDLRKSIGKLRALFDLFSYSYPRYENADPWETGRKLLDQGYGLLGAYKDLFDRTGKLAEDMKVTDYDLVEVNHLRYGALIWKERFIHHFSTEKVRNYFQNPLRKTSENRPERKRPKYYWRLVNFTPAGNQNAREIFLKMSVAVLASCATKFPFLWNIEGLREEVERVQLHDFRKQLRNMIKLPSYLPELELLDSNQMQLESLETLKELVKRFGYLNDKVLYLHDLRADKEAETQAEISHAWKLLQEWLLEKQIPSCLQEMLETLEANGNTSGRGVLGGGREPSLPQKALNGILMSDFERELKFTLDEPSYNKVKALFPTNMTTVLNQANYYFDITTPNGFLLRQSEIVLRVRQENDDAYLTLKQGGKKETQSLFVREEYECRLKDPTILSELTEGIRSILSIAEGECENEMPGAVSALAVLKKFIDGRDVNLKLVAQNKTLRLSSQIDIAGERFTFELDRTTYPGSSVVGYELEVELDASQGETQEKAILATLQNEGISFAPSLQSKAERTFHLALRTPSK